MASEEHAQPKSKAVNAPTDGGGAAVESDPRPLSSLGPAGVLAKIKRHKIVEWSLAYIAFGYAALHGSEMVREAFGWSALVPRLTLLVLLVGFPVAVTLAWYHGYRGRQRVSAPELLILSLLLTIGGTVLWALSKPHGRTSEQAFKSQAELSHPVSEKSIAVLPFLDLSEKHDQGYFADGMAEEILNLLAEIPELKVIGRTSSFQFKDHPDDLRSIGAALGALYIVEGSVRRYGDHIRVTAQLIDARDGTHRWAETYDRDAGDVLLMQAEIAASLVRASELEVSPPVYRERRLSRQNADAYDMYLRGLQAKDRFDQSGFEEAVADQQHALELEPGFAPAAEQLALDQLDLVVWRFVPREFGVDQARLAAERALKLDDKSALSHAVLGVMHSAFDWDRSAAEREMQIAVALAPRDPKVLQFAGIERLSMGELTSAVRLLEAARTLDPLDPALNFYCGEVYARLGRFSEAEAAVRRVLDVSPTYEGARAELATVLLIEGNAESALNELKRDTPVSLLGLSLVYEALHRYKEADAALAHLKEVHAQDAPASIAKAYAFRGQNDQAFEWLERAYTDKDIGLWLVKGDPLLSNLAGDRRYKAFLRRMNLPD